jgi:hypothetical protein
VRKTETDERGVRYDSPFYPHTLNCIRRAMLTNPQPCECGGNEVAKTLTK